jgi:hypothetical protein
MWCCIPLAEIANARTLNNKPWSRNSPICLRSAHTLRYYQHDLRLICKALQLRGRRVSRGPNMASHLQALQSSLTQRVCPNSPNQRKAVVRASLHRCGMLSPHCAAVALPHCCCGLPDLPTLIYRRCRQHRVVVAAAGKHELNELCKAAVAVGRVSLTLECCCSCRWAKLHGQG